MVGLVGRLCLRRFEGILRATIGVDVFPVKARNHHVGPFAQLLLQGVGQLLGENIRVRIGSRIESGCSIPLALIHAGDRRASPVRCGKNDWQPTGRERDRGIGRGILGWELAGLPRFDDEDTIGNEIFERWPRFCPDWQIERSGQCNDGWKEGMVLSFHGLFIVCLVAKGTLRRGHRQVLVRCLVHSENWHISRILPRLLTNQG